MLKTTLLQDHFVVGLLDEIELGLADRYTQEKRAGLPILREKLRSKALDELYFCNAYGKTKAKQSSDLEILRDLMVRYLEFIPSSPYVYGLQPEYFSQMVLVPSCISDDILSELRAGSPAPTMGGDLVLYAWQLARYNYFQTLGRRVALSFLAEYSHYQSPEKSQEAEFAKVGDILNQDGLYFQAAACKFALVLQGEPLKQQVRDLAERSFSPEMSLIEYLTPLGAVPSYWRADAEKAFRDRLGQYLSSSAGGPT
jgi:hypothetical protein